jgi:phosphate transport system permease protein
MNEPETIPSPEAPIERKALVGVMKPIVAQQVAVPSTVGTIVASGSPSVVRNFLQAKSSGRIADGAFASVMVVCALSIFVIVLLIVFVLISDSRLSMHAFGWKFFKSQDWSRRCWP